VIASWSVAVAAPATVLHHQAEWVMAADGRATLTTRWTVRIDDPAAAAGGVSAPEGLDGARDGEAFVDDDTLLIPADTRPGDEFHLHGVDLSPWRSATLRTAPGLPIERVDVTIDVPPSTVLSVWADPAARANPGATHFALHWERVPETASAVAVFGAWPDWAAAGQAVIAHTRRLEVSREELGRELAYGISATSVAELVDRVRHAVALDEGDPEGWLDAAAPKDTLRAKRGSAADRSMVALNLLRLAGFDARPAQFATAGDPPPARFLPAPAQFPHPAIVVHRSGAAPLWIDMEADHAAPTDLPSRIDGGVAWEAGQVPNVVGTPGVPIGRVDITGDATIEIDGDLRITATLAANGAAAEAIRAQLASLPEDRRTEVFARMIRVSRPEARILLHATGVERTLQPLRIQLTLDEPGGFDPQGTGLAGSVPAVLAPMLAAWLPPDIEVHERLTLSTPSPLRHLAHGRPRSTATPDVVVSRWVDLGGNSPTLVTEVVRPYRTSTPEREARATQALVDMATDTTRFAFQPNASPTSVKELRRVAGRPPHEIAVLAARGWSAANNGLLARQWLDRSMDSDAEALLAEVDAWDRATRTDLYARLSTIAKAPVQWLAVAEGLAEAGATRAAWLLAAQAHTTPDPTTRAAALLLMERTQPGRPDPSVDKEGNAAWREPAWLLEQARTAAPHDPAVRLRMARLALSEGRTGDAEVGLVPEADAASMLLRARLEVIGSVPLADVRTRLYAAIALAPDRAAVASEAAELAALAGDATLAAEFARTAARLAPDDASAWAASAARALDAGQLAAAADAALRASDRAPDDAEHALRAARLATLAADEAGARRARERLRAWTGLEPDAGIAGMLALAGDEAAYATLVFRDAETVASRDALARRARARLERGDLDGAARDGLLLLERWNDDEGAVFNFAATAGRTWSPGLSNLLPRAAAFVEGRRLRLEWSVLTGAPSVAADAKAQGDPVATRIARLATTGRLADDPWWPSDIAAPNGGPPPGFRTNAVLSAVPGVAGWSDADRGAAHLRVGTVLGLLPPPLSWLRAADDAPLLRLPDGTQVLQLRGDLLPLFAAAAVEEGVEVWGIATTPDGAVAALGR
jgi:tetratricopeptide (TPR) repeat protein